MSIQGTLKVEVVTPESAVLSVRSSSCTLPTLAGQIQIFPMHDAVIGGLDAGELVVEVDGQKRSFYIEGGFYEVSNDVVSVLTQAAFGAGEIDIEQARDQLARAEADLKAIEEKARVEIVESSVMDEHQAALKAARQRLAFGEGNK